MPDIGKNMPTRQDGKSTHHWTMQAVRDLEDHINSALVLVEMLPPSRELSLTKTKLQEAQMWFREAWGYGSENTNA
jgi:hypothetical protein